MTHWIKVVNFVSFRFTQNDQNIPYQFKKWNKTEQISSHFKSWSVPDFLAKFRPERSDFIPHVPFRSWKAIESNYPIIKNSFSLLFSITMILITILKIIITIFINNDINFLKLNLSLIYMVYIHVVFFILYFEGIWAKQEML